jgi:hypothetical protein
LSPAWIGTSFPLRSPDAPAEEGAHVVSGPQAEIEDVGPLQEEGPLLGEDDGKAREVGAARVDLRLGEVGVDRERGQRVRA